MPGQDAIRLSGTSYAVLGLVRLLGEASPYDLKQAIGYSVENFWPVPHTTSYAEPERLTRAGYLVEEREMDGRRRKLYRLTDRGRQALQEWVSSAETSPPQLRDEATLKVFLGADPQAVYGPRIEWCQTKLDELEGYLGAVTEALDRDDEPQEEQESLKSVRTSLIAGTTYYVKLIEGLEDTLQLIASSRPMISSAYRTNGP